MGGLGSGRRYQSGKDVTTDYLALDVRRLQRDGLLMAGLSFNWQWSRNGEPIGNINIRTESDRVFLNYKTRSNGGDWEPKDYPVSIDYTDCRFGGQRTWFRCPAIGCNRRVAILYGGSIFACRHCHQLVYQSQREHVGDRATRRADKLRDRLGWEPGILNGNGGKPKRMRWSTFERLHAQHDAYVDQSMMDAVRRFGLDLESL